MEPNTHRPEARVIILVRVFGFLDWSLPPTPAQLRRVCSAWYDTIMRWSGATQRGCEANKSSGI